MPWSVYLRKMMCSRFFRRDVHSHRSLRRAIQHFPEIFDHRHRLWFWGLHIRNFALGIRKKLSEFFCSGTSLERRYKRLQRSFWHCWLTTGIYSDELRIDHIYRSFYKQMSFLHMSFWASQLRACKVFQTDWSFLWLQFQLVIGLEIESPLRFPSYLKI